MLCAFVLLNIMISLKRLKTTSASASGFVPGSGAGAVVLEDLETAIARGAKIYGNSWWQC
jgi:3-oxoacyl-(acyl-carrier-protein) synthase